MASTFAGSSLTCQIVRFGSLTMLIENPGPFSFSGVYDHLGRCSVWATFSAVLAGDSVDIWRAAEEGEGEEHEEEVVVLVVDGASLLHCRSALQTADLEGLSAIVWYLRVGRRRKQANSKMPSLDARSLLQLSPIPAVIFFGRFGQLPNQRAIVPVKHRWSASAPVSYPTRWSLRPSSKSPPKVASMLPGSPPGLTSASRASVPRPALLANA